MQQDLFVKICGITNMADAQHAILCGADAIGFVFCEESPRFISHMRAAEIARSLPDYTSKIGVFVNADLKFVRDIVKHVNLSAVQLQGNHGPDDLVDFETSVIKVFRVGNEYDVEVMKNYIVDAFLLDALNEGACGGTGRTFDWNIAVKAKDYGRIILSGGRRRTLRSAVRSRCKQRCGSKPGKERPGKGSRVCHARQEHSGFLW
jgi:phosphoribosylanthranilate isomerase